MIKRIIKTLVSYLFNGLSLLKMKHVGKNLYVGRRLTTHSPRGITLGNNVRLGHDCRLSCYADGEGVLGSIEINDECYICDFFSVLTANQVVIEKQVLIASYVTVLAENHGIDPEMGMPYGKQPLTGKPVRIGECSWIGEKAVILPGVNIGKWCVVGAGSVVTKNLPDYAMAVGNPARIIRRYDLNEHKWLTV